MKRILALVLTLCTLLSVSIVPAFAEDAATQATIPDEYKWTFDTDGNSTRLKKHATEPFDLVSHYAKGIGSVWEITGGNYYSMNKDTGFVVGNGKADQYVPRTNGSHSVMVTTLWESGDVQFDLQQVAVDAGVTFEAPVAGTVEFTYRIKLNDTNTNGYLLIGRENDLQDNSTGWLSSWSGELERYTPTTNYETRSITVNVEQGEKIVFLLCIAGSSFNVNFNFESVKYTSIPTTEGINVVAAQDKNDGTSYNTRFIATVDDYTKYDEIGFKIVADYGNDNVRTYDKHCTEVFDSLLAMEGNNVVQKTALDFNGKYLVTMTVEGIPMNVAGTATFTVQAYYVQGDNVTYTDAVTFNAVNGILVQN